MMIAELANPSVKLIDEAEGKKKLAELLGSDIGKLYKAVGLVQKDFKKSYEKIGSGAQREVYGGEGVVYKIPLTSASFYEDVDDHIEANIAEVAAYETDAYNGLPIAPCRLVWHETGVPIVIMEKVDFNHWDADTYPAWANEVDSQQVAWCESVQGWVIYDAGIAPMSAFSSNDWGTNDENKINSQWRQSLMAA